MKEIIDLLWFKGLKIKAIIGCLVTFFVVLTAMYEPAHTYIVHLNTFWWTVLMFIESYFILSTLYYCSTYLDRKKPVSE